MPNYILIRGEGFVGNFIDKYYRIPFYIAAYSEDQWVSRIFHMTHENLNFFIKIWHAWSYLSFVFCSLTFWKIVFRVF